MSAEGNKALVRRRYEVVWNHGDLDALDALYDRSCAGLSWTCWACCCNSASSLLRGRPRSSGRGAGPTAQGSGGALVRTLQ